MVDFSSIIPGLPLALVLAVISGFIIFISKNWKKLNGRDSLEIWSETLFWAFFLFAAAFVILFSAVYQDLAKDPKILENMPLNAGVLSLSFSVAILILRGGSERIFEISKWYSQKIKEVEKNPFPLFAWVFIVSFMATYISNPLATFLSAIVLMLLFNEVFRDLEKKKSADLFVWFMALIFVLVVIFALVFDAK